MPPIPPMAIEVLAAAAVVVDEAMSMVIKDDAIVMPVMVMPGISLMPSIVTMETCRVGLSVASRK